MGSYVKDVLKKAKGEIDKYNDDLKFLMNAMTDIANHKEPPAKSATWAAFIKDVEALAAEVVTIKPELTVFPDTSAASQADCAKFESVAVNARQHRQNLIDTLPECPAIISELTDMKTKLQTAVGSCDQLTKWSVGMSQTTDHVLLDFFAWMTYDLLKVTKALNTLEGQVEVHLNLEQKFYDAIPGMIKSMDQFIVSYDARLPAMRDYCARHR